MKLNMPGVSSFLCCQKVQQDVMTKNYELLGVFQGVSSATYPFGMEFVTFSRFAHEEQGEFQLDISLYNSKGEKVSDSFPRKVVFGELPMNDLVTAWRVVFPESGTYVFKVFCNNINLAEYKLYCR
jgi:hypothetical protein